MGQAAGKPHGRPDTTMDTPPLVYRFVYRAPGRQALGRATLGYCGLRTARIEAFGPVVASSAAQRSRWLEQSRAIGSRLVHGALPPAQRRSRSDSVMGKNHGPAALESVRSSLACAMTASALTPARSTRLAKSTGRSSWLTRKAVTFGWGIKMRCRPRS